MGRSETESLSFLMADFRSGKTVELERMAVVEEGIVKLKIEIEIQIWGIIWELI